MTDEELNSGSHSNFPKVFRLARGYPGYESYSICLWFLYGILYISWLTFWVTLPALQGLIGSANYVGNSTARVVTSTQWAMTKGTDKHPTVFSVH